ncbi:sorbitol dehydrogenase [Sclerotinia borealis F-4128]|uniref:Sorbitol dehydrogenase n=1 Tax=Sclerotinia borealis (strain F-4128) TaxID=1432307 RepID=W9CRQ1_SCLBF|nr:sorbitol dehydrogenase [Sclerotinia borealis F-4128]
MAQLRLLSFIVINSKKSDLHDYLGGPNFIPTYSHAVTGEQIPITMGHEFSGTIIEISTGVTGFQISQKAAIQLTIADYRYSCSACKRGLENVCYNGGFIRLSGWGGGLSDTICIPAKLVIPLPDNTPLDIGALVEPLSVG